MQILAKPRYFASAKLSASILAAVLVHASVALAFAPSAQRPTLKYAIGIQTSKDFSTMVAAGKALPLNYSETFANALDDQKTIHIALSQQIPEGNEKIADVYIPIPQRPKATVNVIITLRIDAQKKMTIKTSVMATGEEKVFGPFTVR